MSVAWARVAVYVLVLQGMDTTLGLVGADRGYKTLVDPGWQVGK